MAEKNWMDTPDSKVRHDWMWMDRFYRDQLEAGNRPNLHIPHKPTDWSKDDSPADQRHLMDGWKTEWGTCPECFIILSAKGNCACTDF